MGSSPSPGFRSVRQATDGKARTSTQRCRTPRRDRSCTVPTKCRRLADNERPAFSDQTHPGPRADGSGAQAIAVGLNARLDTHRWLRDTTQVLSKAVGPRIADIVRVRSSSPDGVSKARVGLARIRRASAKKSCGASARRACGGLLLGRAAPRQSDTTARTIRVPQRHRRFPVACAGGGARRALPSLRRKTARAR